MRSWGRRYYALFTTPEADQEIVRRVNLLVTLSTVGSFVIAIFGVLAILQNNLTLGLMDLIGLSTLTINLYIVHRYHNYESGVLAGLIIVSIFFISLYLKGGVEKNTFVWYYVYPAVATFLLGSRRGMIVIALMTSPIFLVMLFGDRLAFIADYTISFELRFLGAYAVVGFFAYLFERTGEESRAEILETNRSLEGIVIQRTLELEAKNKQLAKQNMQLAGDVRERRRHEEQIALALKEKEVLLKEVYHRTKNNMNVIISLLNLQQRDLTPENIDGVFQIIADRIKSMSMVHEQLYQSENVATIDLGNYVQQLIEHLRYAHLERDRTVDLHLEASPTAVGLELAVPLGLAMNEILTNSFKYAVHADTPLWLEVKIVCQNQERLIMDFADDGPGLPAGFDPTTAESLGVHLIYLLIHDQLDGQLIVESKQGVHYHIELPLRTDE